MPTFVNSDKIKQMADPITILCLFHGETFGQLFGVTIDRSQYCWQLRDAISLAKTFGPRTTKVLLLPLSIQGNSNYGK